MKFSELKLGMKDSISKTFTDADVRNFAELSCDANPLHLDEAFAKTTLFGRRIVHGILSVSLISALIANKLPGEGSIYLGQDIKFTAPVFLGDKVTAEAEILELREDKKIVKLATHCFKQDGTQVIAGTATVKCSF